MMNIVDYSLIKSKIAEADAIIIGAGAGLSTAAGINYGTENFAKNFPELVKEYGFTDMYTSSFYNFKLHFVYGALYKLIIFYLDSQCVIKHIH